MVSRQRQTTVAGKLAYAVTLLLVIFTIGTMGFHLVEGWNLLDSFYMTLITVTTIGYQEISPLSTAGRLINIMIIVMGVGTVAYTFAAFTQFIVEGEVQRIVGRRRLDKKITAMKDHYIICGHGRIGTLISKELQGGDRNFVVVDSDPQAVHSGEHGLMPHLVGDATNEDVLIKAGLQRAKGLIATASSDVTNVYITLIAKEMNPDIFVLARAETEDSIRNLKRAGADKVISPYMIGGRHMANILMKPTVVDFIDLATGNEFIKMEGFKVQAGSRIANKTLLQSDIRKDLGLIVVSIQGSEGNMLFNPPAEYTVTPGDVLVCIGDTEALNSMERMVSESR